MKRGQISVEYLIVIGFIVFVVIGILGVAFVYTGSVRDQIKVNQLENFANKVISSAESVFFAGAPSKVTITAYLPEGVTNIVVDEDPDGSDNYFIIFYLQTNSGTTVRAFPSDVPLATNSFSAPFTFTKGLKRLVITAGAGDVSIMQG